MFEGGGGTVPTDEAMCRGRGFREKQRGGIDRRGYKRGWSHVKRVRSVCLSG